MYLVVTSFATRKGDSPGVPVRCISRRRLTSESSCTMHEHNFRVRAQGEDWMNDNDFANKKTQVTQSQHLFVKQSYYVIKKLTNYRDKCELVA